MTSSIQLQTINLIDHNHHATTISATSFRPKPPKPAPICPVGAASTPDHILHHHTHITTSNQCSSAATRTIKAPLDSVWSVIRRFDQPQTYKHFLKSCHVIDGDGNVGSLREVRVVSGMPAECSTERLEILDDENYVMSFRVVGGVHRLHNYRSVTTLHDGGEGKTVVVESYVVDVPAGNTKEETCAFVDTILRCNLQSLAHILEIR